MMMMMVVVVVAVVAVMMMTMMMIIMMMMMMMTMMMIIMMMMMMMHYDAVIIPHTIHHPQKLDKHDVAAMRRSKNLTGGDIVDKLVEGSATFEEKTGFSKAKYIRKKMKKHVFTVR